MFYRINGKVVTKAAFLAHESNQVEASKPLPELMNAIDPVDVQVMVKRINTALNDRKAFERRKTPNGTHVELRRAEAFIRDNKSLARLLIVLGADPDLMLNNERKLGYRSNLKGFAKLKTLLDYITGKSGAFERNSMALFAATIIASLRGVKFVSHKEQEFILSSTPVKSFPKELQEAVKSWQNRFNPLSLESRNEASRFRTTFNNLGAYDYSGEDQEDGYERGIVVNMDSPLISYLATRWNLGTVA